MQGITGIELPSIKVTEVEIVRKNGEVEIIDVERDIELIERTDGIICCDPLAVDYWNEEDPMKVHPELEKWATENGYFWEWETPENIKLYNA